MITLVHFNLRDPIMVGKKKTNDVQFYTEVRLPAALAAAPNPLQMQVVIMLITTDASINVPQRDKCIQRACRCARKAVARPLAQPGCELVNHIGCTWSCNDREQTVCHEHF